MTGGDPASLFGPPNSGNVYDHHARLEHARETFSEAEENVI